MPAIVYAAIFAARKPGGVYVVIDNSANAAPESKDPRVHTQDLFALRFVKPR